MSVPGVTKRHRVQPLLLIGATITLVTSCWTRVFPTLAPAVPSSQQLAAIFPAFFLLPFPKKKAGILITPKKRPLFTELPRADFLGNSAALRIDWPRWQLLAREA
jgi:hypothetical protein